MFFLKIIYNIGKIIYYVGVLIDIINYFLKNKLSFPCLVILNCITLHHLTIKHLKL
jgi:hypothetical protein